MRFAVFCAQFWFEMPGRSAQPAKLPLIDGGLCDDDRHMAMGSLWVGLLRREILPASGGRPALVVRYASAALVGHPEPQKELARVVSPGMAMWADWIPLRREILRTLRMTPGGGGADRTFCVGHASHRDVDRWRWEWGHPRGDAPTALGVLDDDDFAGHPLPQMVAADDLVGSGFVEGHCVRIAGSDLS
jgi:hypothetical protein